MIISTNKYHIIKYEINIRTELFSVYIKILVSRFGGLTMSIGYACITIGVRNAELSHCTIKYADNDKLRSVIETNLKALETMIEYNRRNGILLFRISSDIIPFASHSVNQIKWWDEFQEDLNRIGQKIVSSGMRVSMHPGQYTVINSNQPQVVLNSIKELEYHDKFMSTLGMKEDHKMILHIGGVYGDKRKAMNSFIEQYHQLPASVKSRLVIENDDKNYNISEVLEISKETSAPVVFDNLHHEVNPPKEQKSITSWIAECGDTWQDRDGKQKIHYSQQKINGLPGAHSSTIQINAFMNFYDKLMNQNIDIMLEVKDKNLSAVKCINTVSYSTDKNRLKSEWLRYRYFLLSKSKRLYQDMLEKITNTNEIQALEFYHMIEQALDLPVDQASEIEAAERIWEEIQDLCTRGEKNRYEKLMAAYQSGTGTMKPLKNHLLKSVQNKGLEYLEESLYFYL